MWSGYHSNTALKNIISRKIRNGTAYNILTTITLLHQSGNRIPINFTSVSYIYFTSFSFVETHNIHYFEMLMLVLISIK